MVVTHRAVLRVEAGADAATLRAALGPDEGLVRAEAHGTALVVEAAATTPLGLLRTLDDVLVCLRGAGVP